MREDKDIVYVFRKGNNHNSHIEGTYCQIVSKEPEIEQGAISVQRFGDAFSRNERVLLAGDYVKLRKKYLYKYLTFLLEGLHRAENNESFYRLFS